MSPPGRWPRHRSHREWRTPVTVTGPVHRDADGLLVPASGPVTVEDCHVVPGSSAALGMTDAVTSEAPSDAAVLYAPPGAPVRHRDMVEVPDTHPLAGAWMVEETPAAWPMGLVAALSRR
ncbi:Uncharacterised protein [Actinomyces howellii]|uniref:Uncharacterized protein n=1 Tax=Actinomyces howellii TaxID=52771 RepID=A0A3S4RAU4_9ACTO|nr:Uncharacterised protein [Actinomyces howellii]